MNVKNHLRRIIGRLLADRFVAPYVYFWASLVLWSRRPTIVAITGTVGKTTTTNMIAGVLTHPGIEKFVGQVTSTSDNMNNDIGLPLTVLLYDHWLSGYPWKKLPAICLMPFRALSLATFAKYPRVLVLECAAGPKGNVERSVRLARPTIGVVTTIGPAHLDRFQNEAGVVRAKIPLVCAVHSSGLVVLGEDHAHVSELERAARARVVRLGGRGEELARKIARVVADRLGVPSDLVTSALQQYEPAKRRLNQLHRAGMTVIDDSYNANPLSMKLGLDVLSQVAGLERRRVAVLGYMAELGADAANYHREIGAYARSKSDVMIGVGNLAREYQPDHWFGTSDECASEIWRLVVPGDCILVKGSASVKMDRIVERLSTERLAEHA